MVPYRYHADESQLLSLLEGMRILDQIRALLVILNDIYSYQVHNYYDNNCNMSLYSLEYKLTVDVPFYL